MKKVIKKMEGVKDEGPGDENASLVYFYLKIIKPKDKTELVFIDRELVKNNIVVSKII